MPLSIVVPMVDRGGGQGEVNGRFVPVHLTAGVSTMWTVHWCVTVPGGSATDTTRLLTLLGHWHYWYHGELYSLSCIVRI